MHCWIRSCISEWAFICVLLAVTMFFVRGNPLPLNTTTVHLSRSTNTTLTTKDNNATDNTGSTISTVNLNNTDLSYGSSTSDSDLDTLSVLKFNTTDLDQTTTANATENDDHKDEPSPNINLAIIPALAILIFFIVLCLRCCKCFRSYTRGSDKEDGNHYASIVSEEDEAHMDIVSDSASTAYNDTVSSYCSFLKRSGNDNTINSFRSFRDSNRQSTPKGDHPRRLSMKIDRKMYEHSSQTDKSPSTIVPSSSAIIKGVRTLSTSSEEVEPLTGSFSDSSDAQHPTSQLRKSLRFKVSFIDSLNEKKSDNTTGPKQRNIVTSTSEFSPNIDDRLVNGSKLKRGSMSSRSQPPHSRVSHSEKGTPVDEDVVFVEKKPRNGDGVVAATATVSIAVQTDKSFRYNLWKAKRRYFSDPGHDPADDHVVDELTTYCPIPRKQAKDINDIIPKPLQDKTSKTSTIHCHSNTSNSELASESENEPNAVAISPSDSSDDVFELCERPAVRYCKCSAPVCNGNHVANHRDESVTKVDSKELRQDNQNNESTCKSTCHLTRPLMLKTLNGCNGQHDEQLPICSRCKSAVVVLEGHQNSNVFYRNCDNVYFCDICFNNRQAGMQNGRVITKFDKENIIEGVSRNEHGDLIIGKDPTPTTHDLTSSITSLESSGYAELSSESSN